MVEVPMKKLKCMRCGHEWFPRQPDVRQCPHCKSVHWETPRPKKVAFLGNAPARGHDDG